MAAAVRYGMAHESRNSMHPFFQTALRRAEAPEPSLESYQSGPAARLDGISEDDTSTSADLRPASPPEVVPDPRHSFSTTKTIPQQPTHDLASERHFEELEHEAIEQVDIDPNYERRKRRKTTSPGAEEREVVAHQLDGSADGSSWRAQLEEAAQYLTNETQTPSKIHTFLTQTAPKPKHSAAIPRRSLRQEKTCGDNEIIDLEGDIPDETAKNAAVATPNRRMLKLSVGGKLISPPQTQSPSNQQLAARPANSVRARQGKLAPTFEVVIRYGNDATRLSIGSQIDGILQQLSRVIQRPPYQPPATQATHPFFLGKVIQKQSSSSTTGSRDASAKGQESGREDSVGPELKPPTDWKDLGFKTKKTSNPKANIGLIDAIWPPNKFQHVVHDAVIQDITMDLDLPFGYRKLKQKKVDIWPEESIMQHFAFGLSTQRSIGEPKARAPDRKLMTAGEVHTRVRHTHMAESTPGSSTSHEAVFALQNSLLNHLGPLDLGMPEADSDWVTRYAPQIASHVLQRKSEQLKDWLSKLSVRDVRSTHAKPKKIGRSSGTTWRKRKLKEQSEMDDFIASDEDELFSSSGPVKNAILVTGPSGCGKTASVYAVAKDLDFEIFELHPGMRRSAKDIFDKVGDMTQNHLVRQSSQSRPSSSSGSATPSVPITQTSAAPRLVANFFGPQSKSAKEKKSSKKAAAAPSASGPSKPQKESLVLFEEVDILYDDDRSFWNGVKALIEQSKRPVILTCNDLENVPVDELPLHAVLKYEQPGTELVADYLMPLVAKEGHLLSREAVTTLYECKGRDLRATITELQLWCQMTVGSRQGGLDWMLDQTSLGTNRNGTTQTRVMSEDTYRKGLDLFPHVGMDSSMSQLGSPSQIFQYASDELGIPYSSWYEDRLDFMQHIRVGAETSPQQRLKALERAENSTNSLSMLDLASQEISTELTYAIVRSYAPDMKPPNQADLVRARLNHLREPDMPSEKLRDALEPLKAENSVLSLGKDRLAPSLEAPIKEIAIDIAPYVRTIAAFDKRLEEQRDQLAGGVLGKKKRTTRASRAALEGGSKASTRGERWFPRAADYEAIQKTGGEWPQLIAECE